MSQSVRGAVAQRQSTQINLVDHVRSNLWPEMQRVMPKGLDQERMMRLALTVIRNTPKLAECDPASYVGALLSADALGLDPGVDNEAYLVPYGRECTLIVGYQGYVKLFWQNPLAQHIDAQAVYDGDEFDYAYGTDAYLVHKPAKDRGKTITHFYGVAALSSGGRHFTVLTPEECKELRQGKVGPDPRFKGGDPMHWMERKTALRQLVKLLPKSRALQAAAAVDERRGSELAAYRVPQAIATRADLPAELVDEPVDQAEPAPPVPVIESPPATEPSTGPITKGQLSKLDKAFTAVGWTIAADRLRAVGTLAGRQVGALAELTAAEAQTILGVLDKCIRSGDPQTELTDALEAAREAGE
jgi:recombination protein RecT